MLIITLPGFVSCSGDHHNDEMMGDHPMMGRAPASPPARKTPANSARNQDQTVRQFCSGCHAAPDPGQHRAQEWPAIVARMRQHMVRMGRAAPDSQQLGDIIDFLQSHASAQP